MDKKKLFKTLIPVVVLVLIFFIVLAYKALEPRLKMKKDMLNSQTLAINPTMTPTNTPSPTVEPKAEVEEEKFDEAVSSEPEDAEPLSYEDVELKDIYANINDIAVFNVYDKDAIEYSWEVYSNSLKEFKKADEDSVYMGTDNLNRKVSCLKLQTKEFNQMVKCVITTLNGEYIQTAYLIPYKFEGEIFFDEKYELGGDRYISKYEIPVSVIDDNGNIETFNGLKDLYFLTEEDIDNNVEINDLGQKVITRISVLSETDYIYLGIEEKEVCLSLNGKQYKTLLSGVDNKAPVINEVKVDYDISNKSEIVHADIEIDAEDDITILPELNFAFELNSKKNKDIDWQLTNKFGIDIEKNGIYTAYVKDKFGNISSSEVEIIAVDVKPPKINSVNLEYNDTGWVSENKIVIDAEDKCDLKYATSHISVSNYDSLDWQESNTFKVTENGNYKIYVQDTAGNISSSEIMVNNIDNESPVIKAIKENQ